MIRNVTLVTEVAKLLGQIERVSRIQGAEKIFCENKLFDWKAAIKSFITKEINVEGFHAESMDERMLETFSHILPYIERIREDFFPIGELIVIDDGNKVHQIADCNRVKALQGALNLNHTIRRESNYCNESNEDRLRSCLDFVKQRGYPFEENYILLYGDENTIMDGWHRASCLYYLYGNLEVPVRRVYFKPGTRRTEQYIFPYEKVPGKSRVAIYGAGDIGASYVYQLKKNGYCKVAAWLDKDWKNKEKMFSVKVIAPEEIKKMNPDYVVIAVREDALKLEMEKELLKNGVPAEKIVHRSTWE